MCAFTSCVKFLDGTQQISAYYVLIVGVIELAGIAVLGKICESADSEVGRSIRRINRINVVFKKITDGWKVTQASNRYIIQAFYLFVIQQKCSVLISK